MACMRPINGCGMASTADAGTDMVGTCVFDPAMPVMGTCRLDGTAAGASCRTGGTMACDTGLTCSGSALSFAMCQSAATTACDPTFGTTVCPTGQVCRATAFNTGTCAAPTAVTDDLGSTPDAAGAGTLGTNAHPITTATVVSNAMPLYDVDCLAVQVAEGGGILAQVTDGNGLCTAPTPGEIRLDVYGNDPTDTSTTPRLTPLGQASNSGPAPFYCATIDGNRMQGTSRLYPFAGALHAGVYVVCAVPVNDGTTATPAVSSYYFTVAPLPPTT
jgi:hypothetical protein